MLAKLQRLLIFGLLSLTVLWFSYFAARSEVRIAIFGVLLIIFGHAFILTVEFLWMIVANKKDGIYPPPTWRQIVRAWCGEIIHAPIVFCWRQPFRSNKWKDAVKLGHRSRRGIILVHGFVCNRGLWNHWYPALASTDTPFHAVNLEPVFGSIDLYVSTIETAVRWMERTTGQPPVVVAHSMGGLAVRRWWVGTHADRLHHLITIGTPHQGTLLARWASTENTRQMRRESSWRTNELEAYEDATRHSRTTCFFSTCDNIVFPASTATIPGATNRLLKGVAHVHMVDRAEPLAEVLRRTRD